MAIPRLYTTNEVADMLRVTRRTINCYIKLGKLHPIQVNGRKSRILFTENDIRDFLGMERGPNDAL